jgi:hypothetical protein
MVEKGNSMSIALYIAVEPGSGRPVSLARIDDPAVLRQVAKVAIHEARQRAARDAFRNLALGQIRADNADQLERHLGQLIPGLKA